MYVHIYVQQQIQTEQSKGAAKQRNSYMESRLPIFKMILLFLIMGKILVQQKKFVTITLEDDYKKLTICTYFGSVHVLEIFCYSVAICST